MRQSQSTKPTKDPFFKGTNETDTDLRTTLNDPYFETGEKEYKECTNPNDPNDKYTTCFIRVSRMCLPYLQTLLTFTNDFDDSRPCRTEHGVVTSNDDNNNTHCWQKFVYK